jgi:hypothetical protein
LCFTKALFVTFTCVDVGLGNGVGSFNAVVGRPTLLLITCASTRPLLDH